MPMEYTEADRAKLEVGTLIRVKEGDNYPLAFVVEVTPDSTEVKYWTGKPGAADTAYHVDDFIDGLTH